MNKKSCRYFSYSQTFVQNEAFLTINHRCQACITYRFTFEDMNLNQDRFLYQKMYLCPGTEQNLFCKHVINW